MATANKNLSSYSTENISNGADFKIGIVVSDWNDHITNRLMDGAMQTLLENGVKHENILVQHVPGAFELPLGAQYFCEQADIDGVVTIGVVIQGETRHFDFVCSGTTQGIMDVMLKYNKPVAYCVLTDNHEQQSLDRAGGKHGNKGIEAAAACLQMISNKKKFA